jgi:hypothetical protein
MAASHLPFTPRTASRRVAGSSHLSLAQLPMIVYHELFPEAYLLVLAADPTPGPAPEAELAAHLRQAARSGKPAVWVDCRLLPTLPRSAARLLWACHYRLRRRQAQLVLCRRRRR